MNAKSPPKEQICLKTEDLCPFLKKVLGQFNLALKACGEGELVKMPLGVMCDPRKDVPSRALARILAPRGEPVSVDRITVHKEFADAIAGAWKTDKISGRPYETTSNVFLPGTLKRFVRWFDRGKFPDLVEQNKP